MDVFFSYPNKAREKLRTEMEIEQGERFQAKLNEIETGRDLSYEIILKL